MPCHLLTPRRRPKRTDAIHLLALSVVFLTIRCHHVAGSTAIPAARAHTWSFLNIQSFTFVGNWNNQTYQAQLCLRNICHNSTTNIVRMMVFVHDAPHIMTSPEQVHSITPAKFLENGTIPGVWFQSIDGAVSVLASVLTSYEQLIRLQEDATALVLAAELSADVSFTLRMEGSERVHLLPIRCGPRQHPLFSDRSVWLGTVHGGTVLHSTAEHSRLAFQPPPPNTRSRQARNQAAADHGISDDLVNDLAALLGPASPVGTISTSTDSNKGPTDSSNSNHGSAGTDSSGGGTVAEGGQQTAVWQRKLLQKATSTISTALGAINVQVLDHDHASGSSSSIQVPQHQGVYYPFEQGRNLGGVITGASSPTQAIRGAELAASPIASHDALTTATAATTREYAEGGKLVRNYAYKPKSDTVETAPGGKPNPQEVPVPNTNSSSSSSSQGPGFRFGLNVAAAVNQDGSGTSSHYHTGHPHDHRTAAAVELNRSGAALRFLALQHLAHHRALGFTGSIMVVTAHTADQLMHSRQLRRAMQQQRLVLIVWDQGLEPRATHFMQVPAYNLLRLAAWGSNTSLGFWDLDEYLVLPGHESVSNAVFEGCMSATLAVEPEAVLPSMWVSSHSWNASAELAGWMQHGYWSKAVQNMHYVMWPYTFCDGACKSIIHPHSDLLFQVHQHARPPPRQPVEPISWRCGYILHFYRLWSRRTPELMAVMGYEDVGLAGIPLFMDDILSQAGIQHLARSAKLYADLIGSNPELAL